MSFRIFLLAAGLSLAAATASAQEGSSPESAVPGSTPDKAADKAADKPAPAELAPLDPAALLSIGIPRSKEERDEMEQRSELLREESRLRKERAESELKESETSCWKKFLVSACLDDARVAYRKDVSMSKRQEREAQTLARNVRKYDALEKARIRDEENARKDAANAIKAEKYRAKRAAELEEQKAKGIKPSAPPAQ